MRSANRWRSCLLLRSYLLASSSYVSCPSTWWRVLCSGSLFRPQCQERKGHTNLRKPRLPCTPSRASEMGKKWPKNGFWPHRKKGGKMAEKWENRPKMDQKWPFSHFSAISPPFRGGAKILFSAISSPFRAGGPIWGLYRAIGIANINLRKSPRHRPGVPGKPCGTNRGLPAGVPGISCYLLLKMDTKAGTPAGRPGGF